MGDRVLMPSTKPTMCEGCVCGAFVAISPDLVGVKIGPRSRLCARWRGTVHELKQVGWAKAAELVKVARSDGQRFESAIWLHKARELPQVEFKHEVEKHLTGKDTEPYELVTFKLYKSQLPVVEQALETAGLMLGSDKSRGYCLEMICADFLAGAHAEDESPRTLLVSILQLVHLLPPSERQQLVEKVGAAA